MVQRTINHWSHTVRRIHALISHAREHQEAFAESALDPLGQESSNSRGSQPLSGHPATHPVKRQEHTHHRRGTVDWAGNGYCTCRIRCNRRARRHGYSGRGGHRATTGGSRHHAIAAGVITSVADAAEAMAAYASRFFCPDLVLSKPASGRTSISSRMSSSCSGCAPVASRIQPERAAWRDSSTRSTSARPRPRARSSTSR